MNQWEAKFDFTLLQNWPEIREELMTALKFTGWDSGCQCHACRLVRRVRQILQDNGVSVEILT